MKMAPKQSFMQPTVASKARAKSQVDKHSNLATKLIVKNGTLQRQKCKAPEGLSDPSIWDIENTDQKTRSLASKATKNKNPKAENSIWDLPNSQNDVSVVNSNQNAKKRLAKPKATSVQSKPKKLSKVQQPKSKVRKDYDAEYLPSTVESLSIKQFRPTGKPTLRSKNSAETSKSRPTGGDDTENDLFSSGSASSGSQFGGKTLVAEPDVMEIDESALVEDPAIVSLLSQNQLKPSEMVSKLPRPIFKTSQSGIIKAIAVPEEEEPRAETPQLYTKEQMDHFEEVFDRAYPTTSRQERKREQAWAKSVERAAVMLAEAEEAASRTSHASPALETIQEEVEGYHSHEYSQHDRLSESDEEPIKGYQYALGLSVPSQSPSLNHASLFHTTGIPVPGQLNCSPRKHTGRGLPSIHEIEHQARNATAIISHNKQYSQACQNAIYQGLLGGSFETVAERFRVLSNTNAMQNQHTVVGSVDETLLVEHMTPTDIDMATFHQIHTPEPFAEYRSPSEDLEDIYETQHPIETASVFNSDHTVNDETSRIQFQSKVVDFNDRIQQIKQDYHDSMSKHAQISKGNPPSTTLSKRSLPLKAPFDQADRSTKRRKISTVTQRVQPPTELAKSRRTNLGGYIRQSQVPIVNKSSKPCYYSPKVANQSSPLSNKSTTSFNLTRPVDDAPLIFQQQLLNNHHKRERDTKEYLQQCQNDIKQRKLEALSHFKDAEDRLEAKYRNQDQELCNKIDDELSTTKTHEHDPATNTYTKIPFKKHAMSEEYERQRIEYQEKIKQTLQLKEESRKRLHDAKEDWNNLTDEFQKIATTIQDEIDIYDFKYGVTIYGEDHMKKKFQAPDGYVAAGDQTGIIPRCNWIKEKVSDMIQTAPDMSPKIYEQIAASFLRSMDSADRH